MAVLEMQDMVEVVEIDLVRLDERVVRDVVEAVEVAERSADPGHAETSHWSYSVPFPGVRYYSYEDYRQRLVGVSPKLR